MSSWSPIITLPGRTGVDSRFFAMPRSRPMEIAMRTSLEWRHAPVSLQQNWVEAVKYEMEKKDYRSWAEAPFPVSLEALGAVLCVSASRRYSSAILW